MIKNQALSQSLLVFKIQLARELMLGLAIVCAIGLPVSLLRWFSIGFQNIFLVHIAVTIVTFWFYFKKDKSNYKLYMLVIILMLNMMILVGVLSFGLQSGAIGFSVFCAFIIAVGWGLLPALCYAAAWCVFLLVVGVLFVNGHINYLVPPNEYGSTYGAWSIVAVGSSMIIVFTLISAKQAYSHFKSLIEQIELQKKEIEELANKDSLTGFLCKRLSAPHLQQAIDIAEQENTKVALLYIDLNDFKLVNDAHGHHCGDEILVAFSNALQSDIRSVDKAYRIGGDEFLVILPNIHHLDEVNSIVTRIVAAWQQPIITNDQALVVTGSIGVAVYPTHSTNPDKLRIMADNAMYKAKKEGVAFSFAS